MTADVEGDVVVFLIGLRINRFRAVRHWLPAARAMGPMLKELSKEQGRGLLGFRNYLGSPRVVMVVQYWESSEKLIAYASDTNSEHRPAWAAFNRRARAGKGHVGVWHETYVVPARSLETVYVDMPDWGLAAAHGVAPVAKRGDRAAQRLGQDGAASDAAPETVTSS